MGREAGYGQYCPLSMASEILATRWTFLVLRELLEGSTSFNGIARGVPLMSRSLLSRRLGELCDAGLLVRHEDGPGRPVQYKLTDAGLALGQIVRSIAVWGQEWIATEPSLDDVDTDFLMWDMRRNVRALDDLPPRFVVRFRFPDAPEGKSDHWLVFENGVVDLCYIDPGHEVTVFVEGNVRDVTRVWMGWIPLPRALEEEMILVDGPKAWTTRLRDWWGLSSVASIQRRPEGDTVRPFKPSET